MSYHRIQKNTTFIYLLLLPLLLLLLWTPTQTFADVQPTTGTVVVTLKPLYSLTAHLTEGVLTPELLVKQPPASHHHHLKPSERRLLADANLIIWFGPAMEGYLQNIIEQQEESKSVTVVTALQADGIKLLSKRRKTSHPKSQKEPQQESQEELHQGIQQQKNIDPHVWLSTYNAKAISKHIAQSLKIYDPKNTELYEKNLQSLLAKIEQTEAFIKTTLTIKTTVTQQPFITYHDAFQYFENENQLNHIDSISYDEETSVSLKHMRHIKELIVEKKINCLVYQPPKPAIVNSLTIQAPTKATALDPMALTIHGYTSNNSNNSVRDNASSNKNAWFSIMHQLATGFKECLTL